MPCTSINLTEQSKQRMQDALAKLDAALADGTVTIIIGRQGGIAFRGWSSEARDNWTDVCAFRRLQASNSAALRKALARAETVAGRQSNAQVIGSGLHSHDEGKTWAKD